VSRTSQSIIYSDREDAEMVRVRRRRFFTTPLAAAFCGGLLSLLSYVLVGSIAPRFSPEFHLDTVTLIAIGFLGAGLLGVLFVWEAVVEVREGVELSESSLRLFGKVILVASIRRAVIVYFPSGRGFGPVLAVDYDTGISWRGNFRTRFLFAGVTKDLLGLTNAIRSLKGWSAQRETLSCRWKDWKTSRGEAGVPPAA